ncbi:MAG: helix-turn-helix domain-containing protein, partial [Gemmatimonadota bacterium]|nr:helix-turn-helix domain-containing protein [Gemmatimonadota bacterium]
MSVTLPEGTWYGRERARRRVGGLLLSETVYPAGEALPLHEHERAYFCLVVGGGFTERVGRSTRECGPATMVFHPAGASHADRFGDRACRCFNVELNGSWLERMSEDAGPIPDASTVFRRRRANWVALHLHEEFVAEDPAADLAIEGLALALVADVLRAPEGPRERAPSWLDRALEVLHAAFPADPGLAEIAEEVGVHPVHLARVFRRHHGCSMGEYARRLRVERAAEALTST